MNGHMNLQASTLAGRLALVQDLVTGGAPLTDVLTLLCHIVEAEAESLTRAAILLVDPDAARLRTGAAPGLPGRYNDAVDGIRIAPGVGTCAAAAACGETVVTPDIASDPAWSGLSHLPLGLGLLAAWSMPIKGRDGRVLGTFGTYFSEARTPTAHERELVSELSTIAATAIEQAQARDAAV